MKLNNLSHMRRKIIKNRNNNIQQHINIIIDVKVMRKILWWSSKWLHIWKIKEELESSLSTHIILKGQGKVSIILPKLLTNIKTKSQLFEIISLTPSFSFNFLKNTTIQAIMLKISLSICNRTLTIKVFLEVTLGKITVVLDLDETLVHCFEDLEEKHEVEIPVNFPGGHSMLAPVNIRPHAK